MVFSDEQKARRRNIEKRLATIIAPEHYKTWLRSQLRRWLVDLLNENRGMPIPMIESQLYRTAEALGAEIKHDDLAGQYYFPCPYCGGDYFGEEDFHATTECAVEDNGRRT